MGTIVDFKRPDGKACSGYYAEPEKDGKAPGIVVIQEWWGLNDQIIRSGRPDGTSWVWRPRSGFVPRGRLLWKQRMGD